jgi:hypothetical protein
VAWYEGRVEHPSSVIWISSKARLPGVHQPEWICWGSWFLMVIVQLATRFFSQLQFTHLAFAPECLPACNFLNIYLTFLEFMLSSSMMTQSPIRSFQIAARSQQIIRISHDCSKEEHSLVFSYHFACFPNPTIDTSYPASPSPLQTIPRLGP